MFAEIALPVPIDRTFTYSVPDNMQLSVLSRVKVNFHNRLMTGFVLSLSENAPLSEDNRAFTIKPIVLSIDESPVFDERLLNIARWMHTQYLSSIGENLSAITPPVAKTRAVKSKHLYTGAFKTLSPEQAACVKTVADSMQNGYEAFLLYGVTGSGKTEVYKELVKKTLDAGKSALILIPEIALTPQTLERFTESFGDIVAVYHSRLSNGERAGEWMRALRGEARVGIGPRSAIFLPLQNLGLIVIDEEHESSYKSQDSPRYHARQIAFYRAKQENATLLLGSATPQIESYYNAQNGQIRLLELKSRFGNIELPSVTTVDLRVEGKGNHLISGILMEKLLKTLGEKKQALLFLNRRGFAPSLVCEICGFTYHCPNCDVSLTYHKSTRTLDCHYCGYTRSLDPKCPSCDNPAFKELGIGTERIEETLKELFPGMRVMRMDLDTTGKKESYDEMLGAIKRGEIDIIVGTQMIAKGHDIEGIRLVGALLPDIILAVPDFRSAERAFVLLTQVIGRAGRKASGGEAVIQTYLPDTPSIMLAAEQNYRKFYDSEIEKRKAFGYPPFIRLGRIVIRGKEQEAVRLFCESMTPALRNNLDIPREVKMLGPVSCPIEKLNNNYRYHIILKAQKIGAIVQAAKAIRTIFNESKLSGKLYLEIDIDPLNLV